MKFHNITKDDMLNGEGLRVVLWVSGCDHQCPGCHNPVTWDFNEGIVFDEKALKELYSELEKDYISGITFSGGDPLHPKNREEIGQISMWIKKKFPDKSIWIYTGYLWEEIRDFCFLKNVDVIVDGKYIEQQKDAKIHWRGSSNQRIIDVSRSLAEKNVVLLEA